MPSPIRTIQRGMAMVDHGTTFTVQTQHDLDPRLWRVRYSDGRDGVFDTDWLLNLANSGGMLSSVEEERDAIVAEQVRPAVIPTPRATAQRRVLVVDAQMHEEHPIISVPSSLVNDIDDAYIQACQFTREIEDAHEESLRTELYLSHCDAETEYRQRNIQAGRIQDINQAHARCNQEWMPRWQAEANAEYELRSRVPCVGCGQRYAGTINVDHRCTQLRAASCSTCGLLQTELINRPQTQVIICQACADRGHIHCRKCGAATSVRSRGSKRVCDNCIPRLQFDVWRNVPRAYGDNIATEIGSHRPFSVEIESFRDPRLAQDRRVALENGWQEGSDGSIHADQALVDWARAEGRSNEVQAIEFKSPPLMGDGGLLKLHDDVKKIRRMGFRANSSCGLHVHVDAAGFDGHDCRAIHKFGKWYEDEMYKLVAPSRRNNQYCRELQSAYSTSDRYRWLNMASVNKHGTVEYRLHHGCTIPVRIAEWAKLCVKFTEAALKYGRARSKPACDLFAAINMSPYEKRYWQAISAELNPPPRQTDGGND